MPSCGIYKITSPTGKIYIGQSVNIERRWIDHKYCSEKLPLYNSFKKYGFKNHIFEIVEECDRILLNERERHYQDFYDVLGENGLNLVLTTTETKPYVMTEESKNKLRGKKWVFSEEVREKSRLKRKNTLNNRTEEEKLFYKNIKSQAQKNYNLSLTDEERKLRNLKTSQSMKGLVRFSPGTSKKVINIVTGEIFDSIKDASFSISMKYGHLCDRLKGVVENNTNLKYYTNVQS